MSAAVRVLVSLAIAGIGLVCWKSSHWVGFASIHRRNKQRYGQLALRGNEMSALHTGSTMIVGGRSHCLVLQKFSLNSPSECACGHDGTHHKGGKCGGDWPGGATCKCEKFTPLAAARGEQQ